MSIQITDDTGRVLGYAASVIDLAGTGPEQDPQVRIETLWPGFSRIISRPWLPIRVGHTTGNVTGADRICTDGRIYPPEQGRFLNAECPDCDSSLAVLPHQEPGVLWFCIEHSVSCPAMAAWIASQ